METSDAHPSFSSLPDVLVGAIADLLLASSSPKEAIQLTTVSKAFRTRILEAEDVWRSFSERAGFHFGNDYPEQIAPKGWYHYYIGRMQNRVLVRQTLRQYIPYLETTSAAALNSKSHDIHLLLFQKWMNFSIACQVWELYRSHDGQQRDGGVHFAYSARLLSLLEIIKEASSSVLLDLREEVWQAFLVGDRTLACTAIGQELLAQRRMWYKRMCRSNKINYLWNDRGENRLLPMTTQFEGKKRFYFDQKGRIYMGNGTTTWKFADSLVEWLQRMMR